EHYTTAGRQPPCECQLVVVDVLAEGTSARHHDRMLTVFEGLPDSTGTTMGDDDVCFVHESIQPCPIDQRLPSGGAWRTRSPVLYEDFVSRETELVGRVDEAIELLLVSTDHDQDFHKSSPTSSALG